MRVAGIHHGGVIALHFFPANVLIIVYGRLTHNVSGRFRGTALRPQGRVIHDVQKPFVLHSGRFQKGSKILPRAAREELVLCVMMVDAVGEKDALGVG